MPGAPNRPPEIEPSPPPAPAQDVAPRRRVVRRLAPARVALQLPLWKGAPSRELVQPLERAEAQLEAGDLAGADSALDQLAVRFAEPRWPTLPEPFRGLRVGIPAPQPPHWDPEFKLSQAEKEASRLRRHAELQLALARATADWAKGRGLELDVPAEAIDGCRAALDADGPGERFWAPIDALWDRVRERVPMPSATRPPPAAAPADPPA